MSRFWKVAQVVMLVLAGLTPALLGMQSDVLAQDQPASPDTAFAGLNYNDLITSSVQLAACDQFRPSTGPVNLQEWERGCRLYWTGSGTVIDSRGLILTNSHVALSENQDEPVWVLVKRTVDARSLPQPAFFGRAMLYSPRQVGQPRTSFGQTYLDLAVIVPSLNLDGTPLQLDQVTMRPLPMAEAGSVGIGSALRNIGYPGVGGDLITITEGSVSGFEPDENVQQLGNSGWIKTDATLGGGISGGTTVNEDGLFIGVPTEAGGLETRPLCDDGQGNQVPCNIAQLNHIRPVPEAYALLTEIGNGDGLPEGTSPATEPTAPEDPAATTDGVTITGSIVSADTGQPVPGAWFIVIEPGVPVSDYLNGQQDAVYTFATSNADGTFQLKKPIVRGEAYGVAVIARGFSSMSEDGRVLAPADAPAVVSLEPVQMALQR
jgi:hypothetical protein